jgi:hypothetical protein
MRAGGLYAADGPPDGNVAGQAAGARETEVQKAVDEFKIQTRNLGIRPDSPHKARGPQSGAKAEWHGRVFDNLRNDFLDAIPHEVKQRGSQKSTLRRNQFGFNVAGPVVLPRIYNGQRKTFFSLSYEGVRENVSRSYLRTVPTLAERTGDWSATVDQAGNPLPVYDPNTTRPNPAFDPSQPVSTENLEYLRDPFPDNRILPGRLDPAAKKALEFYPAPNTNVGPFFLNNYFVQAPETNVANGMIGKLDHNLSERHRLTLSLAFSNGLQVPARMFPSAANPTSPERHFSSRRGTLEHVLTASARTINTFTFEASTDVSRSGVQGDTNYPEVLGLRAPGTTFPSFYFAGTYLSMGRGYAVSRDANNRFGATDSVSVRRGKHSIRLSGTYTRYQVNTFWPAYPSGSFSFSSGLTSLPGIVNTGHPFASFLLGLSEYASLSVVGSPSYFRRESGQISYGHTYEARKGLTFSLGLTLDANGARREKYDRQSTVDLNAVNPENGRKGALIFAGRNGIPRTFQPMRVRLEPSASMAWNPSGDTKSVLRLSYYRSYSAIPIYSGQWGTQGFNGSLSYISQNAQLQPAIRLAEGLPGLAYQFPDLRPDAANNTVADLIDRTDNQPVYQAASLSIEREMPGSVVLTVGASHSGGKNQLTGTVNPNAIPIGALSFRDQLNDESFNRLVRPYSQYLGFDVGGLFPAGKYERDAASLRMEKRASQGLTVSASYEYSKQMDDYSGPYGTQDYFNRRNEWALSAWNPPHRFSFSAVYELPVGPNKPLLNFSDWRRHLLAGWSVSEATNFYGGYPLALHPQFNNTGGVISALRVNVVPGVDPQVPNPGPDEWFNPAAFDQPPDFSIGDASRTHPALRSPNSQNHDLSLTKRVPLAADRAVEFSAVGLNFVNHANWSAPDTLIGPASAPNANAGKIIGSRGGRVIQVGLRFSF